MASQTQKNVVNPKASLCHHGLVKILVMDELSRQGREWRDFVQKVILSRGHPPAEDVPPAVDDHVENPSIDASIPDITPSKADDSLPVDTPLDSDQVESSSFINPQSDNAEPEQTPAQEVQHRKSMWKTPKRKRGSNHPFV